MRKYHDALLSTCREQLAASGYVVFGSTPFPCGVQSRVWINLTFRIVVNSEEQGSYLGQYRR